MNKKVTINIDNDVYEKFCLSLKLTNETEEAAFEACMCSYITMAFEKASKSYSAKSVAKKSTDSHDFTGKAIGRIPIWSLKPQQYNHKIIKAYFTAIDIYGKATISSMEKLCSDSINYPELYVPTFKSNYAQMKLDGPKSYGKVFEDDGDEVWIWDKVEYALMKYKSNFYQSTQ